MSQHPAHSQDQRHPDEPSAAQITSALKGADYPLRKEKILALARNNGADGEVLAVLNKLGDKNFDSTDAVVREATRAE